MEFKIKTEPVYIIVCVAIPVYAVVAVVSIRAGVEVVFAPSDSSSSFIPCSQYLRYTALIWDASTLQPFESSDTTVWILMKHIQRIFGELELLVACLMSLAEIFYLHVKDLTVFFAVDLSNTQPIE
jgi:hypothetical protein